MDCRGYGTPSLRGIPLASRYGNTSLITGKLGLPQRPMLLLFQNISYRRSRARVRTFGRQMPISMYNINNVGIISSARICNGRLGRLQFDQPGRDLKQKGGAL